MNKPAFDPHQNNIKSVIELLNGNNFSYSAEIIPPRNGTDFIEIFNIIDSLQNNQFDFISVTHGAGGSLRGGTLPIAFHAQKEFDLTAIAHLTCRGMSSAEMENTLVDHHYFGIHNILALRGDPPDGLNQQFTPAEGGYQFAYELVNLIKNMNSGHYLKREGFDKGFDYREGMKTRFCIGVAAYPEDPSGIDFLKIKKDNGAQFAITQLVFDSELFLHFNNQARKLWQDTFPILPGIRVPLSFKQIVRMKEKFKISVEKELFNRMESLQNSEEKMAEAGIEWAVRFIKKIQSDGVKGVHFFIMGNSDLAIQVKKQIETGIS